MSSPERKGAAPAWRRAPAATLAVVALASALVACGGGSDAGGESSGGGEVEGDLGVAQPLVAVVLDFIAPVSGESTRNTLEVLSWQNAELLRECGGDPDALGAGELGGRIDQVRYPDFELIEAEGVIIANDDPAGGDAGGVPEPDPQAGDMAGPPADPAVAECLDAGIPELDAGMELSGTWHTNVVAPLFSSEEAQRLDHDATDCLRQQLSASADELPDLNHFFAYVDSVMMHAGGAAPSREQAATLVADWETTATGAFLACTPPYYDWFFAELEAARPEFVDQHREAIDAFAAELEARGYVL